MPPPIILLNAPVADEYDAAQERGAVQAHIEAKAKGDIPKKNTPSN